MASTVKVNGLLNSLVHKGSGGQSIATLPDVCKTPSPGGPVPIPYPNITQSATLAKGTTTVKADGGMMIANKGSEFSLSNGDNAGVAGGVKSSTFMKESTWILYSFDVKMDGKNACRFTDKKFQNHENTVDAQGELQPPKPIPPALPKELKCGEFGQYGDQKKRTGHGKYDRDHIPSKAALKERAKAMFGGMTLTAEHLKAIEDIAMSVVIPKSAHQQVSPTYGGRNTPDQILTDADKPAEAAKRDTKKMREKIAEHADADCVKAYNEAADQIDAMTDDDYDAMIEEAVLSVGV